MSPVAIGTIVCGFFSSSFALLTYAITSLGDAISFQIVVNGMQIFGLMPVQPLSQIIAEYSLFGWPCSLLQTMYLWRYIDYKLAFFFGVFGAIGLLAGLELLMMLQGIWLKRCVGFLILGTLIFLKILTKLRPHLPDAMTPTSVSITRTPTMKISTHSTKTRTTAFHFGSTSYKNSINSKHGQKYEHQKPIMMENRSYSVKSLSYSMLSLKLENKTSSANEDLKETDVEIDLAAAIAQEKENYLEITSLRSLSGIILAAVAAGFCHGLFGIGGPPLMIWILCTEINSFQFRSSISFSTSFFAHPITGYFLIIYKDQLSIDLWAEYTAILVGGVFGLLFGNYLANKLNQVQFREVVQFLLMIGALVLSLAGFAFDAVLIPIIVGTVFIAYIVHFSWIKLRVNGAFQLGRIDPDLYNTDMEME